MGEVFGWIGRREFFCRVRLSRFFGEWGAFGYNALHECRDSACRRPFGVRLRGNGWFRRSPLHGDAAPLRMTQWGWRFAKYNPFVAMLLYMD